LRTPIPSPDQWTAERAHWQTQQGDDGVQFDAHAAHTPFSTLSILADLAEQLAHGTGTRRTPTRQTQHIS
jgi:hypothetical protein